MAIRIVSIGTSLPAWTYDAYNEYAKRLAPPWNLELIEVPAQKRTKTSNLTNLLQKETDALQARIPHHACVIALDRQGQHHNSIELAKQLSKPLNQGREIAIIIGGPEGLAPSATDQAEQCLSLSALTFPHPLVRVILSEQIYRAYSICHNHPYHK